MLYLIRKLRFSAAELLRLCYSIPEHANIIDERKTWILIKANGTSYLCGGHEVKKTNKQTKKTKKKNSIS